MARKRDSKGRFVSSGSSSRSSRGGSRTTKPRLATLGGLAGSTAALLLGVPGLFQGVLNPLLSGDFAQATNELIAGTTGLNFAQGGFDLKFPALVYGPTVVGALFGKAASKLGINRSLGRAGSPILV